MNILNLLVTDHTFRTVALGCSLLGMVSGILGCFAVLRKQSLLGDAVSHASLPGVCLAFLLTNVKNTENFTAWRIGIRYYLHWINPVDSKLHKNKIR